MISKPCWRSDHFPVLLKPIALMKYKCCSKRNTDGGWKWENDNSRTLFCNEVMAAMTFEGSSHTMGFHNDGQLFSLESVMCDAAQLHASNFGSRNFCFSFCHCAISLCCVTIMINLQIIALPF